MEAGRSSLRHREIVATVAAPTRGMQVQRDFRNTVFMDNKPIFLEILQRGVLPVFNDWVHVRWLWLFTGGSTEEVTVRRLAGRSGCQ